MQLDLRSIHVQVRLPPMHSTHTIHAPCIPSVCLVAMGHAEQGHTVIQTGRGFGYISLWRRLVYILHSVHYLSQYMARYRTRC